MIANALFAVCQLKVDVIQIQSIQKSDAGFYVLAVCGDVLVVAQASAAADEAAAWVSPSFSTAAGAGIRALL